MNKSLWEKTCKETDYPLLSHDLEVDVAIIGAGITGVTAANELIKAGKKVALIEADKIGKGTTGYSTGNLYIPVQSFYQNIVSKFDLQTAQMVAHSRKFAIDYIEKNTQEKKIACHFSRRPWYAYTQKKDSQIFDKEVEFFKKINVPINYVKDLPLPIKFSKAIEMPNQARFNPLQYVVSLTEHLFNLGCLVFEKTRVLEIQEKTHYCILTTQQAKVHAKHVFIATHTPIGVNSIQLFTAPYRSYVIAAKTEANHYPESHFWNFDNLPFTLCTHPLQKEEPELILISGSHHKTGQGCPKQQYQKLEATLNSHFKIKEVTYHWSAQHYQSADDLPYFGLASTSSKRTYMATGYWADGLTYGTLAGVVVSGQILGKSNDLATIYQATRAKLKNSSTFLLKENTNVFGQYLKDFPLPAGVLEDVAVGEGKIIEVDREKYAVTRDEKNKLHVVSAVCTHMKCIVSWNEEEKTWDCPCHGSRFSCDGKVIEGPATESLKPFTHNVNTHEE